MKGQATEHPLAKDSHAPFYDAIKVLIELLDIRKYSEFAVVVNF